MSPKSYAMQGVSESDEKENKVSNVTKELNSDTINKNNKTTSVHQETYPITIDMVNEALQSINSYDIQDEPNDINYNEPAAEFSDKSKYFLIFGSKSI